MFGKNPPELTPEPLVDDFSLSRISEKDDVIASIKARRAEARQHETERSEASLAPLDDAERAYKQRFRDNMRQMAKEAGGSYQPSRRHNCDRSDSFEGGKFIASTLALGALGVVAIFGPGMLTDAGYGDEKAAQFLEEAGYTDVELTGETQVFAGFQGCDSTDTVKYSFEATAVNGVDTDVMVCKGFFKGATIRK